jgi:hypothetical protein
MNNANNPAMPLTGDAYQDFAGHEEGKNSYNPECQGLTKREMFAMNLMAAYRSQPETMEAKPEQVAEWAIEDADALLKELEK